MLKIKPFRQTAGFCGPASLKMILDYYGLFLSESEIAKLAGTTKKNGTKPKKIIGVLKLLNFHGFWKEKGIIEELKFFVKLKLPIIIDWFSQSEGHYSVVVGFNKNKIILMDPEIAKTREIAIDEFKKNWWDFEGPSIKKPGKWHRQWFLVVLSKKRKFEIKGNYF